MKVCKSCGQENPDSAKFCTECGSRLTADDKPEAQEAAKDAASDEEEVFEDIQPMNTEQSAVESSPELEWHYVQDGQSVGPVSASELQALLDAGKINGQTYIWTKGQTDWQMLDDNPLFPHVSQAASALNALEAENAEPAALETIKDEAKPLEKTAESFAQGPEESAPAAAEPEWFYVKGSESMGPYPESQFLDLIAQGRITPLTNVYSSGMSAWTPLKDTALYAAQNGTVSGVSSAPDAWRERESQEPEDNTQVWHYAEGEKSKGPFSQDVMKKFIEQGVLKPGSYVWRDGWEDWKHLRDTELAVYLPSAQPEEPTFSQAYDQNSQNGAFRTGHGGYYAQVPQRGVLTCLLLSIFTCGIYFIVWIYQVAKDVNTLAAQRGQKPGVDPLLAVLLSLFTCNLFFIYYFYREGQTVYAISRGRLSDNSIILAILGYFLPIASLAILQDQINTIVREGL